MVKTQEKSFWHQVLNLALPVAVQGLLYSALSIVNQIMVGEKGTAAVVAVSLASKNSGVLMFAIMGLTGGLAIMAAQLVGSNQREKIAKYQGMMGLIGLVLTVIFVLVSLFAPEWSMRLFTNDSEVIKIGVDYHRMLAVSYFPSLLISLYSTVLRADGYVKFPMMISMLAVPLNALLNYLLIFGNFGFPELGVAGSALATSLVTLLEAVALLLVVYRKKLTGAFSIKSLLSFYPFDANIKQLWLLSLPLLGDNLAFVIADTIAGSIFGFMGTAQTVAVTVMMPVQLLIITFFGGFGTAASVMIGQSLGRNEMNKAYQTAKKILYFSIYAPLILGGLVLLGMKWYLPVFHLSSYSLHLTWVVMILMVIFIPTKVFNMIIGNILSAGGETKFLFYIGLIGAYVFGVPLGLLTAFVLHWPIHLVFAAITIEEIIRMALAIWKFKSKSWLNNLVLENNDKDNVNEK